MHVVFKLSMILLGTSAAVGQSWIHAPAGAGQLASMREIARACPSLAVEAGEGRASRYDALRVEDAYLRTRLSDAASHLAGGRSDGCAARA